MFDGELFSWQALQALHFLRPFWLLAIIPLAILIALQLRKRDPLSQWQSVIAAHLLPSMIVSKTARSIGPLAVLALISLLLPIALAGPSWEKKASPFAQDNAALIIALDLSASMEQGDVQPSRLLRAKQKISALLALRGDSYTALIAYAGTAHTVIPLSNDRQVISHFLDAVTTTMMPRTGKAVQKILPLSNLMLADHQAATLLVIGDGATQNAISAFEQYFQHSPQQLLVWGMGLNQQQLNQQTVASYTSAITPLQDGVLKKLADQANGYYQAMTIDSSDVEAIYRRINQHFLLADENNRPWVDAGYWLLFPLLALFALWFREGWTIQW